MLSWRRVNNSPESLQCIARPGSAALARYALVGRRGMRAGSLVDCVLHHETLQMDCRGSHCVVRFFLFHVVHSNTGFGYAVLEASLDPSKNS